MNRVPIRVEPFSTYLERRRKGPIFPVIVAEFNEIYVRYFPVESPARIFLCVSCFPGPLDIEIDCVAVV